MKVVFVHGIGQQKEKPDNLKEKWVKALEDGLNKQGLQLPEFFNNYQNISLPYYGKGLYEHVWNIGSIFSKEFRGVINEEDNEYLDFCKDALRTLSKNAGITEEQINTEYLELAKMRGPQNWTITRALAKVINKVYKLAEITLFIVTREAFLYARKTKIREEVDEIVKSAISTDTTILVSHSLGTVISYNILNNDSRKYKIPLYITLGSPLGIPNVRDDFAMQFPPHVKKWFNYYDEKDIVALTPLDSVNFPIDSQEKIENIPVTNDEDGKHGIEGYLGAPEVAKCINDGSK